MRESQFESTVNPYEGGFERGMVQIRLCDVLEVRDKLCDALQINRANKTSFNCYLHGKTEPHASNAQAVTDIFKSYDIYDCWGQDERIYDIPMRWKKN